MTATSCDTCSVPLETVEHADEGPPRAYCESCAGCDPDGDWLSHAAMCDACASAALVHTAEAIAIRAAVTAWTGTTGTTGTTG